MTVKLSRAGLVRFMASTSTNLQNSLPALMKGVVILAGRRESILLFSTSCAGMKCSLHQWDQTAADVIKDSHEQKNYSSSLLGSDHVFHLSGTILNTKMPFKASPPRRGIFNPRLLSILQGTHESIAFYLYEGSECQ